MQILNRNLDTIYVCWSNCNNIDSIKGGIGQKLKFDESGKIILSEHNYNNLNIILPDSTRHYVEPNPKRNFFRYNENSKGYFFIIKLEIIKQYAFDEIKKNNLYEKLIISREMLEKNDWKIHYYGQK